MHHNFGGPIIFGNRMAVFVDSLFNPRAIEAYDIATGEAKKLRDRPYEKSNKIACAYDSTSKVFLGGGLGAVKRLGQAKHTCIKNWRKWYPCCWRLYSGRISTFYRNIFPETGWITAGKIGIARTCAATCVY